MSTSYYRLKPPVTHLKLEAGEGHDRLRIWVNHALAGVLTLRKEETREFILGFADKNKSVMHVYWGGPERGIVVHAKEANLLDGMIVIPEYGEFLTVAELNALNGAKRKDGMPTELFGYEE